MNLRASFMYKNPLTGDGLIVEHHYHLSDDEIVELLRSSLSKQKDYFVSFIVEYNRDYYDPK